MKLKVNSRNYLHSLLLQNSHCLLLDHVLVNLKKKKKGIEKAFKCVRFSTFLPILHWLFFKRLSSCAFERSSVKFSVLFVIKRIKREI